MAINIYRKKRPGIWLSVLTFLVAIGSSFAQEEIATLEKDDRIVEVWIHSEESNDRLSVRLEKGRTDILGEWSYESGKYIFRPIIPLAAGRKYLFLRNGEAADVFFTEDARQTSPDILAFYPGADTLPSNLLKCYIRFTQPMSEVGLYENIEVRDNYGREVKDVILPLQPALWNEDNTMVTLWIDPGRVKRDLVRNQQLGAPFEQGSFYTIRISDGLRSGKGEKLAVRYVKTFYIEKSDREKPAPSEWRVFPPTESYGEPLRITFGETMDYVTTKEGIIVFRNGKRIAGKASMTEKETVWEFHPDQPWQRGNYVISVSSSVEDLAGNRPGRLFDRDLYQNESTSENISELTFTVK